MATNLPIPACPGNVPYPARNRPSSRSAPSRGFTLIEMMVALAVTLIMMGAVVTLFGVITESVSASRSGIEMADRLRAARNQLQVDLRGVTATLHPPSTPARASTPRDLIMSSHPVRETNGGISSKSRSPLWRLPLEAPVPPGGAARSRGRQSLRTRAGTPGAPAGFGTVTEV